MHIILFQPQIPQNTGNIVRTAAVTGSKLSLVTPLGFSTSSRHLRRAGLDYWEGVDVNMIDDLGEYLDKQSAPFYFFSSHAEKCYSEIEYTEDAILIFGSETSGLPAEYNEKWPEQFARIPMQSDQRCLNLSASAAIVVYEGWRQQSFAIRS
jgi:tRNA (cytidine/uridine-2'-O-)-methyltransferase